MNGTETKAENLIKICKERDELEFLYQITKHIAESDSIGECYSYNPKYSREQFNNAEKGGYWDEISDYITQGSLPIYELYLKQIKVL